MSSIAYRISSILYNPNNLNASTIHTLKKNDIANKNKVFFLWQKRFREKKKMEEKRKIRIKMLSWKTCSPHDDPHTYQTSAVVYFLIQKTLFRKWNRFHAELDDFIYDTHVNHARIGTFCCHWCFYWWIIRIILFTSLYIVMLTEDVLLMLWYFL